MRVLHLTDRVSARGGADWHLLGVLESQAAGGTELLLAAGRDDGSARPPCPVARVRGLAARRRAPAAGDLDALAARFRPDVLHVHNVVNPEALAWAAERGAVMTVQDHRTFCPGMGKLTLDRRVCREPMGAELCAGCFRDPAYAREIHALTAERLEAVRAMARVVVCSRYMKEELAAAGVAPERVTVIPPFVHGLDPGAAPDGPPCVLFAGRLVVAKGVADAVEAWRASGTDLPLVFAGTGAERARLEAEGLEVLGWLSRQPLARAYRRARALLFPPRWQEPFGIAGLEALWMGVPVAAWDSGGVSEWHPDPVGWGDTGALGARLRELLESDRRPAPPDGFDREEHMDRLGAVYGELPRSVPARRA